ncbi:hypothetical protein [Nostoc sp.]|uniref:hypothetical protein n=1 Tax=Nostoc sp. TaxID=1180 RepID=UPI002FFA83B3
MGWRVHRCFAAPQILQLPACGVSADAGDLRCLRRATPMHQSGVFEWAGGVGAKVFGVAGEAEAGLFDWAGRESIESSGIENHTIMQQCCK